MLECLLGSIKSDYVFPSSISYTATPSANSTTGIPSTGKRAGGGYVGADGNIFVIAGTGNQVTAENTLLRYNKQSNSLSRVSNSPITDNTYYVSTTTTTVNGVNYAVISSYDKFEILNQSTFSAQPKSITIPGGGFNHSLACVEVGGAMRIYRTWRASSTLVRVQSIPFSLQGTIFTHSVSVTDVAPSGCISAVYENKVYILTGHSIMRIFDPVTTTFSAVTLTGNISLLNTLTPVSNYTRVENNHMYVPVVGTKRMFIINLKTFVVSVVAYSNIFPGETACVMSDGKIYNFFGNISGSPASTWTINDYPVVPA